MPPAIAVLLAAGLYLLLPGSLLLGPRLLVPALELVLLVALIATNPFRLTRETWWSRWASIARSGVIALANLTALGLLMHLLVDSSVQSGGELLVAALQV